MLNEIIKLASRRGAGEEACSGRLRQFEEMERLKLGMQLPKVNFLDELQVSLPAARTRQINRAPRGAKAVPALAGARFLPSFGARPHRACGAQRGARARRRTRTTGM